MTVQLIGLSGKKQRGKDTVAKHLEVQYGYDTDAFAAPLKYACARIFGLSYDQLYGGLKEVVDPFWGSTPREILQRFGTEVGREFSSSLWVQSFTKRFRTHSAIESVMTSKDGMRVVVTDCRFPNEIDAIHVLGGAVWRIERDMPASAFDNHASETALDGYQFDAVIENNGTLAELFAKVDRLME